MVALWIKILKEQSWLAERLATEVPKAIAHSHLSRDQAFRIYGMVKKGAEDFDRIVEDMRQEDLDAALYRAAERLQEIWSELSVTAANKVRALQSLDQNNSRDEEDKH